MFDRRRAVLYCCIPLGATSAPWGNDLYLTGASLSQSMFVISAESYIAILRNLPELTYLTARIYPLQTQ